MQYESDSVQHVALIPVHSTSQWKQVHDDQVQNCEVHEHTRWGCSAEGEHETHLTPTCDPSATPYIMRNEMS